jgi:hypothetical protein
VSRVETVTIECDLNLHEGRHVPAETHRVSLDGRLIEVDLCTVHLSDLETYLTALLVAGGHAPEPKRTGKERRTAASRRRSAAIRAWAINEGLIDVSAHGRLRAEVVEKYKAAHGSH